MPNPPAVAEAFCAGSCPSTCARPCPAICWRNIAKSRVPAVGEFRADLWYWRQVGGMWLRAYWWLVVPAVLLHRRSRHLQYVSRAFGCVLSRRPADTRARRALAPRRRWPLWARGRVRELAHGAMAGRIRRRTRDVLSIAWLFMAVWGNATFYPFAQVQQSNPYWIQAWQWSTIARTRHRFSVSIPIRPMRPSSAGCFGTTSEVCSSLASRC